MTAICINAACFFIVKLMDLICGALIKVRFIMVKTVLRDPNHPCCNAAVSLLICEIAMTVTDMDQMRSFNKLGVIK